MVLWPVEHFEKTYFRYLLLATALDPRYKLEFFEDEILKSNVRSMLLEEVTDLAVRKYGIENVEPTPLVPETAKTPAKSLLQNFRLKLQNDATTVYVKPNSFLEEAEVVCLFLLHDFTRILRQYWII